MKRFSHTLRTALPAVIFIVINAPTMADERPKVASSSKTKSSGDWCKRLSKKPGSIYRDTDNPIIQKFVLTGRLQWQAAYLTGEDTNGYGFSDYHTEVRRFRLGFRTKFLNYFSMSADVNLVDDASNLITPWPGGQKLGWGYEDFDVSLLAFDIKKAFGVDAVDKLSLKYGRHKLAIGTESWESSKRLLTLERSAIADKIYGGALPTGVSIGLEKGDWDLTAALYSTDAATPLGGNTEFLGGWNDGLAYYVSAGYRATKNFKLRFDYIYNNAEGNGLVGDDSLFRFNWASSLAAEYENDQWGMITNLFYGDNGDISNGVLRSNRQGEFWGAVVIPYYWLVEGKLQGVVRYQYQGSSESQGIRVDRRYTRSDHGSVVNAAINRRRGNEHQSIYAGVNYYACDHNLKFQTGLEHEWLNTPGVGTQGEVSTLTYWFGVSSYF